VWTMHVDLELVTSQEHGQTGAAVRPGLLEPLVFGGASEFMALLAAATRASGGTR
jgi:hypothetical protein